MKSQQANKYLRGQDITNTKEVKSFNSEIKEHLTPT